MTAGEDGLRGRAGSATRRHGLQALGAFVALFLLAFPLLADRYLPPHGANAWAGWRPPQVAVAADTARPNIVVVMTDDQTTESLRFMPKVRALIADHGLTFENAFASYPLCCPARATYFTGMYAHNHRVLYNRGHGGGYHRFLHLHHEERSFPVALQRAGYHTAHIGKYLNGYGYSERRHVPPGWDDWYGSVDPSTYRYYRFVLNENGTLHRYPRDKYQTTVYSDLAVRMIDQASQRPGPFFLEVAYLAPHAIRDETSGLDRADRKDESGTLAGWKIRYPVPERKYRGAAAHAKLPHGVGFDEADVSDKPEHIRDLQRFDAAEKAAITRNYRMRAETLLSVDDGVERIVDALAETGQLDRTVIVFVSDNGFFHGEHRMAFGKFLPYEPSIRAPLIVRGPGVAEHATTTTLVTLADLAPTFLHLASAPPVGPMDGRSLTSILADPGAPFPRDAILLESGANDAGSPVYAGIRTARYKYVEYTSGERELYDLRRDPAELVNRADDAALAVVELDLRARLARLRHCRGRTCNTTVGAGVAGVARRGP